MNQHSQEIRVWSLNCPPDYIALGYITTKSPEYPTDGDIYCVRRLFVELGNMMENHQSDVWESVWDSTQYESVNQVKLFQQKSSTNPDHINPEGFSAASEIAGGWKWKDPNPAYYLKKLNTIFYPNVPVRAQWLKDQAVILGFFLLFVGSPSSFF